MSYLGEPDRQSTWEVSCNECGRKVRGEEPPADWTTDKRLWKHFCPECAKSRRTASREG